MQKKIIFLVVFAVLMSCLTYAQTKKPFDSYKAEADGYFTNISLSDFGVIATDNYASKLYLIKDGRIDVLYSSAGCGRYYNLSPDKQKIGLKVIGTDGKQMPAIFDILTKKIKPLYSAVDLCGQVSFSNNGAIAFTVSEILYVLNGSNSQTYNLGTYANIVQLSPDGTKVIYNDSNDQLFVLNILNNIKIQISDNSTGFIYPKWSPDGKKISCNSLAGDLFVYNVFSEQFSKLDENAGSAVWSDDSEFIFYQKNSVENFVFKGSEIFKIRYNGTDKNNLTNSPDVNEMSPYILGNNLFFNTYERCEIIKTSLNADKSGILSNTVLYKQNGLLPINYFSISKGNRAVVRIPGSVPYVHQVYDTPEWHYGYGSCAPTTCIMAFAYYNKLPKWPIITSNGIGNHSSNYGAYVADRYRFNEIYYQDISATGGGEDSYGGYGYMWTGSYSPNSRMKTYIENHGLTSNQLWTTQCTYANTITEIDLGFPHPICNYLTTSGHLILAIGYLSTQHTMIFNDPYGNKNNPGYPNANGADAYYDWPGYNNGYQNLDASGTNGGVAWTTKARGTEVAYNDTLIDDVFYNHGFYINNSQNTSTQRYFRDQITGGYNNHFWFTGTVATTDVCYVTWTPTIASAGNYQIYTYIPGGVNSNAVGARYKVHHSLGVSTVVVDQTQYTGQWASLGTYYLSAGQNDYVYLGDSTGIASQMIAFDAMKFSRIGSVDNIAPTTVISSPGTWKTGNFTATFTDTDNSGGSGIEKSYYQVLENLGTEWRANKNNGFFADNFDAAIHSDWTSSTGTWSISNGMLYQSDTVQTNANIYASLNQGLSNRYLYNFTAKFTGSTTNKRFGFHFFSDNGSLSNRGNSYFVFFRVQTSKLEFYKVKNDVFTQAKIVDNILTNADQLYDIKVIYDRTTGKMDVYRDDALIGTWSDTLGTQYTTGSYISFRSGNSKLYVNELKVYRSRAATANISVGSAATNDIHYQNPNPTTYGAKIKSIVNDVAGNLSAIAYNDLNIDWSSPTDMTSVSDGFSNDIDTILVNNQLSANWSASSDPNSGILRYWYCVGSTIGGTQVLNWADNGTSLNFTANGLSLTYGQTYYVSVKAENAAGLFSIVKTTDGVYIKANMGYSISGVLNYNNSALTPLSAINLNLMNGATQVASTTTDVNGNYSFNNVANGSYSISASTLKSWSGVTATDALKMKRHIVSLEILTEPIRLTGADVNVSASINSTDVLKVQRRIASLDASFTRPDWIFEKPSVGGNSISVNGASITQNFYGLCTGDVNGSNIPALLERKIPVILENYSVINVKQNEIFELPIRISKKSEIGALQLFFNYPENVIEIRDVKISSNNDELIYQAENGRLSIVWSSLKPLVLNNDDMLITMIVAMHQDVSLDNDMQQPILSLQSDTELADATGNVLSDVVLNSPNINVVITTSSHNQITGKWGLTNYPNPFNKQTEIEYEIAETGNVSIKVYDILGKEVSTLVNSVQSSGKYYVVFNKETLPVGIYNYKIEFNNKTKHFQTSRQMNLIY